MALVFEWVFLIYPGALFAGILLHEPAHFLAAKLIRAQNVKMGLTKNGNVGSVKYNLRFGERFQGLKIRFVGLAPIITASIIIFLNYSSVNKLEFYLLGSGFIVFTSWSDLSINNAKGRGSTAKILYHKVPKTVRLTLAGFFIWFGTSFLVVKAGSIGLFPYVIEMTGQLSALFIGYYTAYMIFK